MAKSALRIAAPDPKRDREALLDLVCKTFQNYFSFIGYCRERYIDHSHMDWAASRVGFIGDELITSYCVWDYQTRVGTAKLRTGGIGVVSTHADHRKKGYMDQTARASVAGMRELGYDITILFGVWNFYHRFGYTRAWAAHEMWLNLGDLPEDKPAQKIRKLEYTTGPEFSKLYNKYYAGVTGTAVRPTYTVPQKVAGCYGWNEAGGKLGGYFTFNGHAPRLEIQEAAGEPEQVLRAIAQVAREMGRTEIRFPNLPPLCDLAVTLRRRTVSESYRWIHRGEAMIRILNLRSCLEKMARELGRRVKGSLVEKWRGELTLAFHKEAVTLKLNGKGGVSVQPEKAKASKHAIRGGDEMAQLILGTMEPLEIVAAHGTKLSGDAKKLIGVLFPYQAPMLASADHY